MDGSVLLTGTLFSRHVLSTSSRSAFEFKCSGSGGTILGVPSWFLAPFLYGLAGWDGVRSPASTST